MDITTTSEKNLWSVVSGGAFEIVKLYSNMVLRSMGIRPLPVLAWRNERAISPW